MKSKPYISLILCTVGRTKEVEEFLIHAQNFTFKDFEIILADQNDDERIQEILQKLSETNFTIKHLKTQKGLSRSRNHALLFAEGEIIAFPDDDCLYESHTLQNVKEFFEEHFEYSILVAKWLNPDISGFQPHEKFISHPLKNFKEIFSLMSSEFFFKKNVFDKIGNFDENLGLGSPTIFKGSEDYDILLRAINFKINIYYSADIIIYHPWKGIDRNSSKERIKKYLDDIMYSGASDFYVLKKNLNVINFIKIIFNNILATIYYMFSFDKILFKNHLQRLKGFWLGFKNT